MPEQRYMNEQQYTNNEGYNNESYNNFSEPEGPINNERYTGRLKFFDQNGNYGYSTINLDF